MIRGWRVRNAGAICSKRESPYQGQGVLLRLNRGHGLNFQACSVELRQILVHLRDDLPVVSTLLVQPEDLRPGLHYFQLLFNDSTTN